MNNACRVCEWLLQPNPRAAACITALALYAIVDLSLQLQGTGKRRRWLTNALLGAPAGSHSY